MPLRLGLLAGEGENIPDNLSVNLEAESLHHSCPKDII